MSQERTVSRETVGDNLDQEQGTQLRMLSEAYFQLATFVHKNFKQLDQDNNGYISIPDLDQAEQKKLFNGLDSKYVTALKANNRAISDLSDDEVFRETSGITLKDMNDLHLLSIGRSAGYKRASEVREFGLSNFGKLDLDRDEKIHGYEILASSGDVSAPDSYQGSVWKPRTESEKDLFGRLSVYGREIGHYEPPLFNFRVPKPWSYTHNFAISRQDLADYPTQVVNSERFSLLKALDNRIR